MSTLPNITYSVGVCICYPISGGDGPVYVCHTGLVPVTTPTSMTINWLTVETPATLPTLPCNVNCWLFKTYTDSSPSQIWTITTASTTTKWQMTKVSDSDSLEKPVMSNIQTLLSRQILKSPNVVIPGVMAFLPSSPYTYQFAAFNAPIDASDTITIYNCPFPVSAGTYFSLYLFSDWTIHTVLTVHTNVTSGTGATIYLYTSSRTPVHKNSKCSYCGVSPIIGVKYTCNECIDYDLCSNCEQNNNDTQHGGHSADHALLKIKVPVVVHEGVTCDDCGVSPIEGVRYRCTVCDNYDLCEKCEKKNEHPPAHVLIKAKQPLKEKEKEKETKKKYLQLKEEKKPKQEEEMKVEVVNKDKGGQGQGQGYQGPFAKELKEIRSMGFNSQSTEMIISLLSSAVKEKKNQNDQGVQWVVSKLIESSL